MAGGLLQLAAYGSENQYLNGNPQLSFFKMVYRRYTNFAMQSIEVNFDGLDRLSFDKTTILKTRIPRNADLFSNMFFTFDLPDIYSDTDLLFRWIKNIGTYLINWVRISIGGTVIEQLYGEYIDIYHQCSVSDEKSVIYDKLVANEPPYFNPYSSEPNENPTFNSTTTYTDNAKKYISRNYNQKPSIVGKKLYVPLPFWFHRHVGLAVPLIALQYHEVLLEIECKAIKDLYVIGMKETIQLEKSYSDISGNATPTVNPNEIIRYKWNRPLNTNDEIRNFTKLNDNTWNLNPTLEVNYIFLDEPERKTFAANTHQYLIEKVNKFELIGNRDVKTLELEVYHPVKEVFITSRRDDVYLRNEWSNFTNSDAVSISNPYVGQSYYLNIAKQCTPSNPITTLGIFRTDPSRLNDVWVYDSSSNDLSGGIYLTVANTIDPFENSLYINRNEAYTNKDIQDLLNVWEYRDVSDIPLVNINNHKFYDPNIIESIEIKFNGNTRLDLKNTDYFEKVQPYVHHSRSPKKGILIYSFSIEPDKYQPSGSCNFSHIKKVEFIMKYKNPVEFDSGVYKNVKYNTDMYFVSYNVLQIMGGMGGLMFGN
jgi:hypothetical protein